MGGRGFGRDIACLFEKLLRGYREFFDWDILNSEGRKVFEEAARMLVYEHPEYKGVVRRARRKPTLENVLRVARLVLGERADDLVIESVQGPYRYRLGLVGGGA